MSRLYRKLGYDSAGDFKHDVRRYHQPGAPETATPDVAPDDPVEEQLDRDVDSLKRTYARISTELLTSVRGAASVRASERGGSGRMFRSREPEPRFPPGTACLKHIFRQLETK